MLTDKELIRFIAGTSEERSGIFQAWIDCPLSDDIQLFAIPIIGHEFIEGFWSVLDSGRTTRVLELDKLANELALMMVCEILPED